MHRLSSNKLPFNSNAISTKSLVETFLGIASKQNLDMTVSSNIHYPFNSLFEGHIRPDTSTPVITRDNGGRNKIIH